VIVSAHPPALLSFIEARLEKCDFSINTGRFGYALPFAFESSPQIGHFYQHFSTIGIFASDIFGEVGCLTPCSPGARCASAHNNQTRSARSGATIVRHHCWPARFGPDILAQRFIGGLFSPLSSYSKRVSYLRLTIHRKESAWTRQSVL
jgi:hypothetical protein